MVNPFEEKQNKKRHFNVINDKVKGEKKKGAKARAAQTSERKRQLLSDYKADSKSNKFVDKRFGEGDQSIGAEERALKRFQNLRQKKAKKNFSLSDQPGGGEGGLSLTHGGKPLEHLGDDDLIGDLGSEDFSDGGEDAHLAEARFGGGEKKGAKRDRGGEEGEEEEDEDEDEEGGKEGQPKKTRREVYAEIVAKSKLAKAAKAREKMEMDDRLTALDSEWKGLQGLLQFRGTREEEKQKERESGQGPDEFDKLAATLQFEARAKAAERLKTPEEIAKDKAERLKKKEAERRRRALGEEEEEDASRKDKRRKIVEEEDEEDLDEDEDEEDDEDDEDEDDEEDDEDEEGDGESEEEEEEEEDEDEDGDGEEEEEEDGEEEERPEDKNEMEEEEGDDNDDADSAEEDDEGDDEQEEEEESEEEEEESEEEEEEEEEDTEAKLLKQLLSQQPITNGKHSSSPKQEKKVEEEEESEEEDDDEGEDETMDAGEASRSLPLPQSAEETGTKEPEFDFADDDEELTEEEEEEDEQGEEKKEKTKTTKGAVLPSLGEEGDPLENEGLEDENLPFVFEPPPKTERDIAAFFKGKTPRQCWKIVERIRTAAAAAGGVETKDRLQSLLLACTVYLALERATDSKEKAAGRGYNLHALQWSLGSPLQELAEPHIVVLGGLFRRLILRMASRSFPSESEEFSKLRNLLASKENDKRIKNVVGEEETQEGDVKGKGGEALPLPKIVRVALEKRGIRLTDPLVASVPSLLDLAFLDLVPLFFPLTDHRHPITTPSLLLLDSWALRLSGLGAYGRSAFGLWGDPGQEGVGGRKEKKQKKHVAAPFLSEAVEGGVVSPLVLRTAILALSMQRVFLSGAEKTATSLFALGGSLLHTACALFARVLRLSPVSGEKEKEKEKGTKGRKGAVGEEGVGKAVDLLALISAAADGLSGSLKSLDAHDGSAHLPAASFGRPTAEASLRLLKSSGEGRAKGALKGKEKAKGGNQTSLDDAEGRVRALLELCDRLATRPLKALSLHYKKPIGLKMLDPAFRDPSDPRESARLAKRGRGDDPEMEEHKRLQREVKEARRSVSRQIRRDSEFIAAVENKERIRVDKKRAAKLKEVMTTLERDQAEYKLMKTTGGTMDTSLQAYRPGKKGKKGRMAGNETEQNRRSRGGMSGKRGGAAGRGRGRGRG
uniref:Nucleolar protein 14 n=1 Tax=Chromera velia CCMP2878 TaxID=1169474 RepID=A0A0G4HXP0_9ALVE|eukprot:Cvel_9306.t1-p1 / transcript=Cvel_9306.t1 / gene=Cvel_9306 / organism=Chromera_velia_CCMP2878 / gene_product=Nucleolar protein 14 homolog, putative / transcript_product=Nucleolar protein 14 homolog, putative / location=Cvel_scaffold533:28260-37794(-) / protein_length=1176 / sequence_SO=supercontig / SO=protein_coding / is_pseudo=false